MAPPEALTVSPSQIQAANPVDAGKGFHPGPNGTSLKGFAVKQLNDFHYETARTVHPPAKLSEEQISNIKHTTQGVDAEPYTIVRGPQDWKAADFKGPENVHKWQYHLTEQDVAEIKTTLDDLQARNIRIEDLNTKEEFPLPTLGPKLETIRDEVILGKGFHLIRGFPVDKFSRWETTAAYFGFGLWWGKPQAQNAKGHIVGHIRAIGTDPNLEGVRPYTTNIAHGYHTDNSDIAALLCLRDAEEGGVNNWTSSVAIHNELLRRGRKGLVEALTTGKYYVPAHNVWGSPNDYWEDSELTQPKIWMNAPPFLYYKNRLHTNFKEGAYYYIYKFPNAPRYTALQEEALRTFSALAMSDELRLDHRLQPGDISLVNNLTMLHAKTAFKDSTDPAKRRHLLRLWVAAPNAPELPEDSQYRASWGSVQVGSRGGYWLGHNYVKHAPVEVEYGDLEETRPKGPIV